MKGGCRCVVQFVAGEYLDRQQYRCSTSVIRMRTTYYVRSFRTDLGRDRVVSAGWSGGRVPPTPSVKVSRERWPVDE